MNHYTDFQNSNNSVNPNVNTGDVNSFGNLNSVDPITQVSTNNPPQQQNMSQTPKITQVNENTMKTSDAVNPATVDKPDPTTVSASGGDEVIAEIEELDQKVRSSQMPEDLKEKAYRSIQRLRRMAKRGSYTGEFETVEKYIYWITSIPWGEMTNDTLDISNAKRIMDSSHYGMETVKNLVLDYLAVMQLQRKQGVTNVDHTPSDNVQLNGNANGVPEMGILRGSSANAPVMLFVGLQGVGKTSIAKSIAQAMGRKFIRVSVGAVGSVTALRGQSKAFLDAEPGQIIKALTRTHSMNPVILLDEIDKASGNSGLLNDIMAALLEILDPEQNATFQDHYLDYPVDLSKVFFICTANNLGTLSAALLDRMEVIRFTSYTDEEKTIIAKNYTMPNVLKNMGIGGDQLIIDEAVWPILVRPVGFDAGLRQLERNIATMVRAVARKIVEGAPTPVHITVENVREFVLPDQGPLS
jgi:ATP-dependent Lon protease